MRDAGEKIEITSEHLATMRDKYDCAGMTDDQIISAMLAWEKRYEKGDLFILEYLCFPSFQAHLSHAKTKRL